MPQRSEQLSPQRPAHPAQDREPAAAVLHSLVCTDARTHSNLCTGRGLTWLANRRPEKYGDYGPGHPVASQRNPATDSWPNAIHCARSVGSAPHDAQRPVCPLSTADYGPASSFAGLTKQTKRFWPRPAKGKGGRILAPPCAHTVEGSEIFTPPNYRQKGVSQPDKPRQFCPGFAGKTLLEEGRKTSPKNCEKTPRSPFSGPVMRNLTDGEIGVFGALP